MPLAIAGILRLALASIGFATRGPDAVVAGDSGYYRTLATALAADHRFAAGGSPEVFRPPGYPLFLALIESIVPSPAVVIAVQVCLALVTVALVMRLARQLGGNRRTMLIAGWCAGLDPVLVFWTVKIMAETVWTLALTVLALVLLGYSARPRIVLAVSAGVLLAGQTYIKAAGYFLAPAVIVMMLAVPGMSARRRLRHALLTAAVVVALVAPWHVRNYRETGFAGFSTLADRALYLSAGASVSARQTGAPLARFRDQRRTDVLAEFGSDAAAADAMRARGLDEIRSSPLLYARVHAAGMIRTLLDPGAVEYLRYSGLYPENGGLLMRMSDRGTLHVIAEVWRERPAFILLNILLGAWLVALLAAAARGLGRIPRKSALILGGIALYFVLISGGAHGSSRFRHPVTPLLAVLAAFGVAPWREGGSIRASRAELATTR